MYGTEEPILIISVKCEVPDILRGNTQDIVMIPFTGISESRFFSGKILGTGVDTQKIEKDGGVFLSARYMLEGTDFSGQKCRIFIENQGSDMSCCKPTVITDSKVLSGLETISLRSVVEPTAEGVVVRIYEDNQ